MKTTRILLPLLIVSLSSVFNVLSDHIFPAHLVGTFSRNNREPKYKIEFLPEDSPFHPSDDNLETMDMVDKDGRRYLCYLPKDEESTSQWTRSTSQNISSLLMETEKLYKTPDELLQPINDKCLMRQEGWWSYEICHKKDVRQVHIEGDKVVEEYTLGIYNPEATAAFNQTMTDDVTTQRYHSHIFTNGTTCDLTGTPRQVEVRFVCGETRAMVTSITELSTCNYALTVQCPTLCKHPLFQLEKPVSHTIHCNLIPVVKQTARKEEEQLLGESPKMIASS